MNPNEVGVNSSSQLPLSVGRCFTQEPLLCRQRCSRLHRSDAAQCLSLLARQVPNLLTPHQPKLRHTSALLQSTSVLGAHSSTTTEQAPSVLHRLEDLQWAASSAEHQSERRPHLPRSAHQREALQCLSSVATQTPSRASQWPYFLHAREGLQSCALLATQRPFCSVHSP